MSHPSHEADTWKVEEVAKNTSAMNVQEEEL
jgi:hypothetical protein